MSSYISVEDAETYFESVLGTDAWSNATAPDKTKSLAMATSIIDRLNFIGAKTVSTQENQFPRGGDTAIPQDISEACADLALRLLDGVDPELEFENLRMISQGYSNVRSTYDRSSGAEHIAAGVVSIVAWRKLKPYLYDQRSVEITRVS